MTQPPAPDWSTRLALSVAQEVRRHRLAQGLSAQQLSDRCAQIGMPIQRSVLANLESGRRTTVTISEVLVLAAALEIPPALLVFPLGHIEKQEVLPGVEMDPLQGVDWFGGAGTGRPRGGPFANNALYLYRRHRALSRELRNYLARREDARNEYMRLSADQGDINSALQSAKAELEHLRELISDNRERWRDVPLAERETPPEVVEAKARTSDLSERVTTLESLRVNIVYAHRQIAMLEERIDQIARDLLKVRIDMADAEWIVPALRDDVWGVLEQVAKRISQQPLFDDQQETPEE
ncbi:helix-turn-helix domain-containing protein [Streptomyces sp. NBC_01518]|uniref:helix-turn-helix domain-containing protein n=1 Tax=Streptomyces sp. NBC_01518 TaxID=2903891 RepID=UPI00386B3569